MDSKCNSKAMELHTYKILSDKVFNPRTHPMPSPTINEVSMKQRHVSDVHSKKWTSQQIITQKNVSLLGKLLSITPRNQPVQTGGQRTEISGVEVSVKTTDGIHSTLWKIVLRGIV